MPAEYTLVDDLLGSAGYRSVGLWLVAEDYSRDGGDENPRHRIELDKNTPEEWIGIALRWQGLCVKCGRGGTSYLRKRSGGRKGIYMAVTCPLSVNVGCARSKAASVAYERIVADIKKRGAL